MTEADLVALDTGSGAISRLSTEDLRDRLGEAITLTAQNLEKIAVIWAELERRGEDLSALRTGLTAYLPDIAGGRLDAGVVVRFAGRSTLLRILSRLSIRDQREYLAGKPIEMAHIDDSGELKTSSVSIDEVPATMMRIVFSDRGVRSAVEQARMIAPVKRAVRASGRPIKVTVLLSEAEYESLQAHAKNAGRRTPLFVRERLLAGGLLGGDA